jgi:hypothetical protein
MWGYFSTSEHVQRTINVDLVTPTEAGCRDLKPTITAPLQLAIELSCLSNSSFD